MFIRYQVVRNLLAGLGIVGVIGGGGAAGVRISAVVDEVIQERAEEAEQRAATAASRRQAEAGAEQGAAPAAATTVDDRIRAALLTGRAQGRKAKDAFRGTGQKVNLYDDDRDGRWDRAKQDRDRDGRWDVKWTRRGERINRKVQ